MTLTAGSACTAAEPAALSPASLAAVEQLIGTAACDGDAQCQTIGIGQKACGGPQRYLAWSSRRTDAAALQRAAEKYAQESRAAVLAAGILSDCSIAVDPGAQCVAQEAAATGSKPASAAAPSTWRRCRLRSGAGGTSRVY